MDKSFFDTYFNFAQLKGVDFGQAIQDTLWMTVGSMVFVIIFGLLLGLALYYLRRNRSLPSRIAYTVVSIISNIFRSIPFIILIVLLIPITKSLVGTFIGPTAAIPALVLSAVPFYARLVEIAFREVDKGVLEAADAMGANQRQVIWKVLLPESKPALISGLTVSTITMIGFTAMAGVIGAGGLGQLAYQDGFQRSRWTVCLAATVLLLLLVFIVQGLGDYAVARTDKRFAENIQAKISRKTKQVIGGVVAVVAVIALGTGIWQATHQTKEVTLKVGASPTPHAEILEHVKPILAKQGIHLKIVKFDDYILPNKALEEKQIDANYFQHIPYLNLQIKQNGYKFVSAGAIHVEPMGFYSKRIKKISQLKDGATILTSNSEAEWGRIIRILVENKLVTVKKGTNLETANFDDIEKNPKHLVFKHNISPDLLTTAYQNDEADLIAINANYAVGVNLNPLKDSVILESDNSPYANIITVRKGDQNNKEIKALVKALRSKEVQDWIKVKYKGFVKPVAK